MSVGGVNDIIVGMDGAIKLISIAIGGAMGAVVRHLINISPLSSVFAKFPLPTLFINIIGSFFIGIAVVVFADKLVIYENLRLAIIVGFIGAFTTFSTFEMELFGLFKEREFVVAALYAVISLVVGFAGVALGMELARRFV